MEQGGFGSKGMWHGGWTLRQQAAVRPMWGGGTWLWRGMCLLGRHWGRWLGLGLCAAAAFAGMWQAAQQTIAVLFLMPLLVLMLGGGVLYAASMRELEGTPPQLGHLFATLASDNYVNLLILYLLLVGVSFGVGAPAGAVLSALYRDNPAALLLPLALVWVLRMLLWFTPALVFLQGENPFRAMRLSARTVLGNVLPMTVLMTLQGALVAGAVAAVQWVQTAGAGRLAVAAAVLAAFVLFQVWNALCCYAAYRDVWFEQDAPPPPKVRQPVDDLPEQPQPIQKFCKNKASSRNRRGGGRRCRETA